VADGGDGMLEEWKVGRWGGGPTGRAELLVVPYFFFLATFNSNSAN